MAGLDLTFDGDGRVITDLGASDQISQLLSVGNGKILAVAYRFNNTTPPFGSETILVLYNANGSLDSSFGTGGRLSTGLSSYSSSSLITDDGKIIIAGREANGINSVIRYLANGQLDTSFGTGGKYSTSSTSGNFYDISIRKNPTNNSSEIIVDLGTNSSINSKLLLDVNGQIKPFPIGGSTTATPFSLDLTVLNGIISSPTTNQTDPKVQTIVNLLGETLINELRATFNTPTLKYQVSIGTTAQSDGTILMSFNGYSSGGNYKFVSALAHFNADGTSDANFGVNRLLKSPPGDVIGGSLDKSDRFYVISYDVTTKGNSVYRYTKNGRLDTSFGTNGKFVLPRIGDFRNSSIVIDSQNRAVIIEKNGSDNILNITRVNNNGTIDTTFGSGGQLQLQSETYISSRTVTLGSDDRLFIGGSTTSFGDPTMGPPTTDILITKYDISGTAAPIPPVISFSTPASGQFNFTEFSVNENGVPIDRVTLIRNGNLTQAVSVTIKLGGGNSFFGTPATPTVDYNAADIQVTFAANETIKTISIPIVNDNFADSNERIDLRLENPTGGATLGNRSTTTLTIIDDDLIGTAGNDTINGTAGNDLISGLGGDDTINPGTGKDTIDGGAGNDSLYIGYNSLTGGNFNDSISGGSSLDTANTTITYTTVINGLITGGSNNGTSFKNVERLRISTGSGADNIDISATTGAATDNYYGYSSGNSISSGAGNDTIKGGAGNDQISSGIGNDSISSGAGDDQISSGTGNDSIDGGAGNDSLYIGGNNPLTGGNFNDSISGGNYLDTANTTITYTTVINGLITGGSNNGTSFKNIETLNITTGSGADNIDISATTGAATNNYYGYSSGNSISSGAGNDTIKGGAGNDQISSGIGNDSISSGAGDDQISSGTGNDSIDGGAGNDSLYIGGNNPLTGGNFNDSISGGNYLDTANTTITYTTVINGLITGGSNNGTSFKNIETLNITTGSGANNIDISATTGAATNNYYGYSSGNSISSGAGNDTIKGGAGNDRIDAGAGNDTLKGSGGYDSLTGGAGNDLFILGDANNSSYGGSGEYTTILDFKSTEDKVQLQGLASNYRLEDLGYVTNLYLRTANNSTDKKIAAFQNGTGLNLSSSGFQYVALPNNTSVTLVATPLTVNEDGAINLVYTFTRIGVTTNALTVNYGVGGTATLGTDYAQTGAATFTATTGTVTFAAGAATAIVTVNPTTDTLVEANETVALTLASGAGYTVGTTIAITGTITNDDTQVTLAVAPLTVNEDGVANLVYTFTRAGVTTNALTVNYGVGGTATLGTDYAQTGAATFAATAGTVTFAAGATTATVTINPTTDTVVEANETVALTLASGAGYTVGTIAAATGTIVNDDIPPAISIADLIIVEGINGNPSQSLITVSLNKASSQAVGVNYATSNVTAIAGTDYTATSGILTFAAGELSKTIAVPILNDNLNEANETFNITLTTPTNATIADNQATITITDTISASVTTILPALVENITLTGATAINATGNDGNNVITGNAANNTLIGLNGNDTYVFDADLVQGTDTITETITGGIDTIDLSQTAAAVNINLGLTTTQTVNGNLKLVIPVITLENFIGGSGNDRITGNSLDNTLNGGSGDDRIFAGGGNDFLVGGSGNDVISGGAGNDIFAYSGLLSGATTATGLFGVDAIYDFTSTQDKISLSKGTFGAITSLAGTAIGANFTTVNDDSLVEAQSAAIIYSLSSGGLFYNQNGVTVGYGTNGGEFANILGSAPLVSADFTIVA